MNALEFINALNTELITVLDILICKGVEMEEISIGFTNWHVRINVRSWDVCRIEGSSDSGGLRTTWDKVRNTGWSYQKDWVDKPMIDWIIWASSPGGPFEAYTAIVHAKSEDPQG